MNILLINPSSMPYSEQKVFLDKTSILRVPSFSMPIGLMDIAAYLREKVKNINIKILDMGKDLFSIYLKNDKVSPMTVEQFVGLELSSVEFKPDVVGISCLFSTAHNTTILMAEMVKKKWNDVTVVFGGNHATNFYKILLQNSMIDFVVRGEAELSFTEFVVKVQNGNKNPDVYGIFEKNKANSDVVELSPMIKNLDLLPLPAIDLLDVDFYRKTVGGSLMFSRGCPFQCTFCASHTVHGRKVRFKSQSRILKEFDILLRENGFEKVIIEDDLFATRKKEFLAISDKLKYLYGKVKFFLPQGLSVFVLDEDIIDAMIEMGIDEASVAIESGSEYVQKNIIKKRVSLNRAKRILKYLRDENFSVYVNFIMGFPGETPDLMRESINYIDNIDVDWVFIFHALPLPGSEMYNQLLSQGVINPNTIDWDGVRLGKRVYDTPEISAKELEKLTYDVNIKRNFFNNSNLKHGRFQKAIDIFTRFIIKPYPFHIVDRYCRAMGYLEVGQKDVAVSEFKECVKWINIHEESRRLFEEYGNQMQLLLPYLDTREDI